jgi:hypothetical protein
VSFELHGPLFTIPKTITDTRNKAMIKLIGKYLYFWGERTRVRIYNYAGNIIRDIKSTDDIGRFWTLHILRLDKNTGEHFFGYGDAASPRCVPAWGTCGAEFEKCLDDATCTMLCPTPRYNCDQANFGAAFYDAKTKLLFIDSLIYGAPIYKYDPDTGYIDDWLAERFYPSCYSAGILPYDDTYFYLLIAVARRPDRSHLYRCRWDTLRYEWKSKTYLKDACELVASNVVVLYHANAMSAPDIKAWLLGSHDGTVYRLGVLEPDGTLTRVNIPGTNAGFLATKYMLGRIENGTGIDIWDITTLKTSPTRVATLPTPYKNAPWSQTSPQDLPLVVLSDDSRYYIYLLKYKGVAPVIQYDPLTRRFRVVDLITGNPVTARVRVWCSDIGYPSYMLPIAITPREITVSDWTSPPPCDKGAVTLGISDVVAEG